MIKILIQAAKPETIIASLPVNITNRPELLRRVLSTYSCSGWLGVAEDVARPTKGPVLQEGV